MRPLAAAAMMIAGWQSTKAQVATCAIVRGGKKGAKAYAAQLEKA
jgi:hypothetical protein